MNLLAWEMSATVWWLAHSLVLSFLGTGMRTELFQSCGHCWVFQIWWHNEYKTLLVSSFRDLNCSTGIASDPLALLTAVLLNVHFTSHSRMSGPGRLKLVKHFIKLNKYPESWHMDYMGILTSLLLSFLGEYLAHGEKPCWTYPCSSSTPFHLLLLCL